MEVKVSDSIDDLENDAQLRGSVWEGQRQNLLNAIGNLENEV